MPLKFVTVNDNVFQLLGHFVPQTPTGAPPLDPAGGLPSPRPPRLCSSEISLKNPLATTLKTILPLLPWAVINPKQYHTVVLVVVVVVVVVVAVVVIVVVVIAATAPPAAAVVLSCHQCHLAATSHHHQRIIAAVVCEDLAAA